MYPPHLISNSINAYLHKKLDNTGHNNNKEENNKTRYFKLPYTGVSSRMFQAKLRKLVSQFCKPIDVKLVFTSYKVGGYFTFNDPVSSVHLSNIVYKFTCTSCNA